MTTFLRAAAHTLVITYPQGFEVELEDGSCLLVPWCGPLEHAHAVDTYICRLSPDRASIIWPRLWYTVRLSHLAELARAQGGPLLLPSARSVA